MTTTNGSPPPKTPYQLLDAIHNKPHDTVDLVSNFVNTTSGADVEQPKSGITALRLAVEHQLPEMVDALIKHGADPNYQSGARSWTALHHAADSDIDMVVQSFTSAVDFATMTLPMSRLLVAHGADLEIRTVDGLTARDFAVSYGDACVERWDEIIET